jgi:histone H3/H4
VPDLDAPLTEAELLAGADVGAAPLVEQIAVDLGALAEAAAKQGVALSEKDVFDERGVARIAVIRPCVSRGKLIRNLRPIYTPKMLEANAAVFTGWPMYFDHTSQRLREELEEAGRSVREMAGQILKAWWDPNFTHPDDGKFGYQKGGVLAEVWGTPFIRKLVGNNPALLHTSINAWPKSGKPGKAPWAPGVKGMVIEGIREEPQGSVDYVPRGGAGGRLLAEDERLVVSVANEVYNSGHAMPEPKKDTPDFSKMTPAQLREWAQENHPHLAEAIQAEGAGQGNGTPEPVRENRQGGEPQPADGAGLSEADVQRMIRDAAPKPEDVQKDVRAVTEEAIAEVREQAVFAERARELIEGADGLLPTFKADLLKRYAVTPGGPSPSLLVEEDKGGENGAERTKLQVLEANVKADIERELDRIAEAKGRPRVKGEGATNPKQGGTGKTPTVEEAKREGSVPMWREKAADLDLVESADDALSIHGLEKAEKVES